MLTYERLLSRMQVLLEEAAEQFPGEENAERRRLLQTAIKSKVLSPGQLKHWAEKKIKRIQERFDGEESAPPSPIK
ncbi:hypothetical protein EJ02DRAFT_312015, partial [Clathrospora elynae]